MHFIVYVLCFSHTLMMTELKREKKRDLKHIFLLTWLKITDQVEAAAANMEKLKCTKFECQDSSMLL